MAKYDLSQFCAGQSGPVKRRHFYGDSLITTRLVDTDQDIVEMHEETCVHCGFLSIQTTHLNYSLVDELLNDGFFDFEWRPLSRNSDG